MDKNNFKHSLSANERMMSAIVFGDKRSVAIDQTPSGDANVNPRTGFAYSDFQKVMLQQDLSERRRIMDNLPSFKADFLSDDVPDEVAIRMMQPSNMQLPSEMTEHIQDSVIKSLNESRIKKELDDRQSILDDIDSMRGIVKPKEE